MTARLLCALLFTLTPVYAVQEPSEQPRPPRPNILWISLEDISPDWGCYGDAYAITPVFDQFAKESVRYTHVFTHAPVCAPSRSGLITGMYPTSIATHHMRSKAITPPEVKCFTEYLRAAGYYCTNNVKTDYQFDPPFTAWDENSNRAHWRARAKGQPFFAVFNFTETHESQIRDRSPQTQRLVDQLTAEERHDPAKAVLPPYYPDTPLVRRDWANYHDNITAVQKRVARVLAELEEDGLADDTIVWIWGDHGRGLPLGKRWIYDSGIHAPLLIRVPEKWRSHVAEDRAAELRGGTLSDELIAFVDFAPTVLSLAGVKAPEHLQGQAFLGPNRAKPREHVFAARDRMDERYDVIRAVRDKRYKYIRNFMPHLPYAQPIAYMDMMPTMREWRRLHAENRLQGAPSLFFRATKPVEELYDTQADPHEVHNLANDPAHAAKLAELREQLRAWMLETGDLGLIPEPILDQAQRPDARWSTTAAPVVVHVQSKSNGGANLTLASPTKGASIGYRLKGQGRAAWAVYTGNVALNPGDVLLAKACRIGFRDSETIEFTAESNAAGAARDTQTDGNDWRSNVIGEGVLEKLLALKDHDLDPSASLDAYRRAMFDSHPAMRYCGIVGLRIAVGDSQPAGDDMARLVQLAEKDNSMPVRIAAAGALCRWQNTAAGIPVLAVALESSQPSIQLQAAHALEDLGEQARPLLPRLRQLAGGSSEYVKRVTSRIVNRLGTTNP